MLGRSAGVSCLVILMIAGSCWAEEAANTGLVVAVLTRGESGGDAKGMGFTATIEGSACTGTLCLLNSLANLKGKRLAILAQDTVPISALTTVVSVASKAEYAEFSVFIFEEERRDMARLSDFRRVPFSTDPAKVAAYLQH